MGMTESQRCQCKSVWVLYFCIKAILKLSALKQSFHFPHSFMFEKFGWLVSDRSKVTHCLTVLL